MMMPSVWLRSWRRNPLLTAQFSLTIVIGMGVASALVSLMLALGYAPLPFRDPGQLVAVWERAEPSSSLITISGSDAEDFAREARSVFTSFGAFVTGQNWLVDSIGATNIRACSIQPNAFENLNIRPVLGRAVRPEDDPITSRGTPPAWISYRLWQGRYGSSPSAIGMVIGIADSVADPNKTRVRIVGVLPPRAGIPLPASWADTSDADVWFLLPRELTSPWRESQMFFGIGRLRSAVSTGQAQAALATITQRRMQQINLSGRIRPVVESLEMIGQGLVRKTMGVLAVGVGLVFLAGCVNLAILMAAEGKRRQREIAIRVALRADRWRLWREVATEKCVLTLVSLVLGVLFAYWTLRVLTLVVPAAGLGAPLLHPPPLNFTTLLAFAAFALLIALVWSGLLVHAAYRHGSARGLASGSGLGHASQSDAASTGTRWRLILLAVQAATGICLLAGAALTARTYASLATVNLGPAPRHTVLFSVNTRDKVVLSESQSADFNKQVLSRLERLPGIQTVALADVFPPTLSPASFIEDTDAPGTERNATSPIRVSPSYFRTLGIPILFGRGFDGSDVSGSEPVAIISLDMAQRNWRSPEEALGSQIAFGSKLRDHYKIVGVAANFSG